MGPRICVANSVHIPIAGLGNHTFKNDSPTQLTTPIHKYIISSTFHKLSALFIISSYSYHFLFHVYILILTIFYDSIRMLSRPLKLSQITTIRNSLSSICCVSGTSHYFAVLRLFIFTHSFILSLLSAYCVPSTLMLSFLVEGNWYTNMLDSVKYLGKQNTR